MKIKKHAVCWLTICLLFAANTLLRAASSYSEATRLTLNLSGVTISDVFASVEKSSEYVFVYSDDVRGILNQSVSIKAKSQTIDEILSEVLKDTGLTYVLNDRQVVIKAAEEEKKPQGKTIPINGTVQDEQHLSLPGVSIKVKGTQIGAITDVDGKYFIEVPDQDAVLVFTYIGFEPKEVKVGNQININVNMTEVSTGLNEVVVVGYGSQKKASVIGSITTIDPERLKQSSTRALSNNLAGQLAGVIAVQRTGEPGVDGSHFWIRGISSFQGNTDPLVLVDGIERTLDDMDPAEIESFSVLKDASASAVYGVRGANGVILINTKRGEMGKPKISLHYQQSFTQPVKLPDFVGSADYLSLLNELKQDAGLTPDYTQEMIDKYRNGTDPDLYPDMDWMGAVTKDFATNQRANLTISGGSELLRYSLVASYYGEHGIFERDKSQSWDSSTRLNKYNLRSNVDINLTKTTVVRVNIGGYLQEQGGMPDSSDKVFSAVFSTPPFVHPAQYSSGEIPRVKNANNPWAMATQQGFSTYSQSKLESLFSVEQDLKCILPGLKVKGIFSFDRYSRSGIIRKKSPNYYNPATKRNEDGSLDISIADYGQEFLSTEKKTEWGSKTTYLEGDLSYSHNFGKHYVEGLFLYNQRDHQNGDVVPYRRMGIAGRASYNYDNRYFAEFNFGYNGSENFARGHRFGFFPSVAVGYLLSEEKFMESYKDLFSKIKLRASWGKVGNDQLAGRRFAYITTIDSGGGYHWGVNNDYDRTGRYEGDFGITDMTWETVEKINLGLELGLWNAIDFQVDLFKEHRRDIFMARNTIPSAAGFMKAPWSNFGKVDNKGIELTLNADKKFNDDWYASFHGTFTYAANKIIERDESIGVLGTSRQATGHPVNQLFGMVAERLFTEDDFADVDKGVLKEGIPSQTFTNTVRPGDIKYADIDGDGAITTMDVKAVGGTFDPQIVYGFGGTLKYKNVDLNFFFQGDGKTYRFIGSDNFIPGSSMGATGNIFANYNDRWTPENPNQDAFYPRLSYGANENNNQESTWWLRNMSMLRLKEIELGYSLPRQWISKWGASSVRFYLKGANLLTFSKFDLWDPELDTAVGTKYPIMKSLSAGVDINF